MSRIAYVNGRYVPHGRAGVHIEDRGYQFADGVYEVIAVIRGRRIDEDLHFARLQRSLAELDIPMPMDRRALAAVMDEVQRRNLIRNGIVYLQITRGRAPREHGFPRGAKPAVVVTARRLKPPTERQRQDGVSVITIPDIRWRRPDIKSIALLPNVLGKEQAKRAGAFEAWMVDDAGRVTEGSSTNAWIVTREGKLVTHAASHAILNGVTRLAVLDLARKTQLAVEERAFTRDEALEAAEAFLTSTTSFVLPITRIDGKPVGDGRPGALTRRLLELYERHAAGEALS